LPIFPQKKVKIADNIDHNIDLWGQFSKQPTTKESDTNMAELKIYLGIN
jgi:hypothetical protein